MQKRFAHAEAAYERVRNGTLCAGWSTARAAEEFNAKFAAPARGLLADSSHTDARKLYEELGRFWAEAHFALEALPEEDLHQPQVNSSLEKDLKDLVIESMEALWNELKPERQSTGTGRYKLKSLISRSI